jgi:hypothetical protein
MPERISFATTQWKDKSDKPSCYTQAQWDARNSSKFNGAPFASAFAVDPSVKTLKAIDLSSANAYISAFNSMPTSCTPNCPEEGREYSQCSRKLGDDLDALPEIKLKDITLNCQDYDMKVWDGSTYYELNGAPDNRTYSWTSCGSKYQSYSLTPAIQNFKYPSSRSDVYIPVCGPGTHIQEITRQQMVDLVWRIATFDLTASSFSANFSLDSQDSFTCFSSGSGGTITRTAKAEIKSSEKTKNPTHPTPQAESNLVSLKWQKNPLVGYISKGNSSTSNFGSYSYSYQNVGGDGNIKTSTTSSEYKCSSGLVSTSISASIDISIREDFLREKFIYFVTDSNSGQEKIYLDISQLIKIQCDWNGYNSGGFGTGGGRAVAYSYTLDAANQAAPFSVAVNFLGKVFTLGINGRKNGSTTNQDRVGSTTQTTQFSGGSIEITGKKYYPYANSEGEAVYNVDDGSQLKDPLS